MNSTKPMHEVGDLVYFIGLPGKTLGLVKEVCLRESKSQNKRLYWYLVDWILYDGLINEYGIATPKRLYGDELKKA